MGVALFAETNRDNRQPASKPQATAPSRIWIYVRGTELPRWVLERMTTGEVAENGTFEIAASDGNVTVEAGFAIFEARDAIYACPPRQVQEKLSAAVGSDNPVVSDLIARQESDREQRRNQRSTARHAPRAKANGDQPLRLKPMIGEPPAPQFATVDKLLVDDTYQRSIEGGSSQKLIVKIAENWDWRLCLPLLVSRRASELYVIDGQHRLEAARLRGDIHHLPVVVFDFDDPRAEAELFVQANRSRRQMSKLDDFHAAIAAGDPKAVAVHDIVAAAGLVIGRNQAWQMVKPGEVIFIGAIQRALRAHGAAIAQSALVIVAEAFRGQVLTTGTAIFESLCILIAEGEREQKRLDRDMMVLVLSETGMSGWKEAVSTAGNGYERSDMMLTAMRSAYLEAEAEAC